MPRQPLCHHTLVEPSPLARIGHLSQFKLSRVDVDVYNDEELAFKFNPDIDVLF